MALIDKDKVVAEIQRIKDNYENFEQIRPVYDSNIADCEELLSFLDTLEVKEIDLKKEINTWYDYGFPNEEELLDYIAETAKHFFELGLKAKQNG